MKKKPSNLSRLLGYAEGHRFSALRLLGALGGQCLAGPGALWYIWKILEEVLAVAPHFAQAQHLVGEYGWLAVGSSVLAVLVYIAGLMCSHMGAFRVATNLRIQAMEHIVTLPLGLAEAFGSGKLRKIVNESSGATETYLAHQLPRPGRGHCHPLRAAGAPLRL